MSSSYESPSSDRRGPVLGLLSLLLLLILICSGLWAIFSNRRSSPPPVTLYVLDSSDRMAEPLKDSGGVSRLAAAQNFIAELTRGRRADSQIGLRVFGSGAVPEPCDDTALLLPLTEDSRGQIRSELVQLRPTAPEAALNRALLDAVRDLRRVEGEGSRRLVVIFGGDDTCSPGLEPLVRQEIVRAGITLLLFPLEGAEGAISTDRAEAYIEGLPDAVLVSIGNEEQLAAVQEAVNETLDEPTVEVQEIAAAATNPPTLTPTPTNTPTEQPTDVPTRRPSATPAPTNTPRRVIVPQPPTIAPTNTPTRTPTAVPTDTPTPSPSATFTPLPTDTPTTAPTFTPIPATATFTPTTPPDTPTSSPPTITNTPQPTVIPSATNTLVPSPTFTPTITPSPTRDPNLFVVIGCPDAEPNGICDGSNPVRYSQIKKAHSVALPGDIINVSAGTLTESAIVITKTVTILGAGPGNTIVQAAATAGAGLGRVFNCNSNSATVTIQSLTIQNGDVTGNGGGILNQCNLTLNSVRLINNRATGEGGGARNSLGTLVINGSLISGNSAADGGGIANLNGGALNIRRSAFINNTTGTGRGGGLFSSGTGTNSSLTNTTISSNSAQDGAGIYVNGGTVSLTHVTITANTATNFGGGIYNFSTDLNPNATLLAGNTAASGPDCANFGTLNSQGNNLIGNNDTCPFTPAAGDQVGTPATPINPVLSGLQPNNTHVPDEISPAVDAAGGPTCIVPVDQTSAVSRPQDGDGNGVALCDIGAVEITFDASQPPLPNTSPAAEPNVTITTVNVQGSGQRFATVTGGSNVNLNINYTLQDASCSPGPCNPKQILIGLSNGNSLNTAVLCFDHNGGVAPTAASEMGILAASFNAPSSADTYAIRFQHASNPGGCSGLPATPFGPPTWTAGPAQTIGYLIVSP